MPRKIVPVGPARHAGRSQTVQGEAGAPTGNARRVDKEHGLRCSGATMESHAETDQSPCGGEGAEAQGGDDYMLTDERARKPDGIAATTTGAGR